MTPSAKPIVVMTPVKNEAWILPRFLEITSVFADFIIVADQHSTDESREICRRFAKVRLIDNPDRDYNERSRQRRLIAAARQAVPGPKVLIALDADEILSADSIGSPGWAEMQHAAPGTTLLFEKPDILSSAERCRPGTKSFPLGYVDDGREHDGSIFHSTRIPAGPDIPSIEVRGVRFLHLAMLRETEFFARQRLYSAMENLRGTKSARQRINFYSVPVMRQRLAQQAQPIPLEWSQGWRQRGLDPFAFQSDEDNLFSRQVLELMAIHGSEHFHPDDIWDTDWEALRLRVRTTDPHARVPTRPIAKPSVVTRLVTSLIRAYYLCRS